MKCASVDMLHCFYKFRRHFFKNITLGFSISSRSIAFSPEEISTAKIWAKMNLALLDRAKLFVFDDPDQLTKLRLVSRFEDPATKKLLRFELFREKNGAFGDTLKRILMRLTETSNKSSTKKAKVASPSNARAQGAETDSDCSRLIFLKPDGTALSDPEGLSNDTALQSGSQLQIHVSGALASSWKVVRDPARVSKLGIVARALSGFPVVPKIDVVNCDLADCRFSWYLMEKSAQAEDVYEVDLNTGELINPAWKLVSRSIAYWPASDDVGRHLCLICIPFAKDGSIGLGSAVLQNLAKPDLAVREGPDVLIYDKRLSSTANVLRSSAELRVLSYNVLADLYATTDKACSEFFPYCPAEHIDANYRMPLLLKELEGYHADVICLQEVDKRAYRRYLSVFLPNYGLQGRFTKKGGRVEEGVAVFYRTDKLKLIDSADIVLSRLLLADHPENVDILESAVSNDAALQMLLDRPTVLQVSVCEVLSKEQPDRLLVVANSHIFFDVQWPSVKVVQTRLCLRQLESVLDKILNAKPSAKLSVLFCGDFNSGPDSGVFELMTTGRLEHTHSDWTSHQAAKRLILGENSKPLPEVRNSSLILRPANVVSEFTTYTKHVRDNATHGFMGCLDYVFVDSSIEVTKVLPLPGLEEVTKFGAIPSKECPSDHLAVVCEVRLKG